MPVAAMTVTETQIQIGYISGVYGLKGWLKIFSYTDPKENILTYATWQVIRKQEKHLFEIENGALQGKRLIAKLAGIETPEAAEQWLNAEIYINRTDLPPADEGEYYWFELHGLDVVTQEGFLLGQVKRLLETGAHDVLVVTGERERLIPFVMDHIVKQVDIDAGYIQVDWSPDFE